jgi:hypothetical protein
VSEEFTARIVRVHVANRRLCSRKFAISGEQVYGLVYSSAAPQRFLAGTPTQAQRINRAMGGAEGPGFQNSEHRKSKRGSEAERVGENMQFICMRKLHRFICLFIYLRLSLCLIKHHTKTPHEG